MEQADTQRTHFRPGGGPLRLDGPQGGGDPGVAFPDHAGLMVVQLAEGDAQLLLVGAHLPEAVLQQIRRCQLHSGIARFRSAALSRRQRRSPPGQQCAGQQEGQQLPFPLRSAHIGNTCIPCHIMISARMPTTAAKGTRDFKNPCRSSS